MINDGIHDNRYKSGHDATYAGGRTGPGNGLSVRSDGRTALDAGLIAFFLRFEIVTVAPATSVDEPFAHSFGRVEVKARNGRLAEADNFLLLQAPARNGFGSDHGGCGHHPTRRDETGDDELHDDGYVDEGSRIQLVFQR